MCTLALIALGRVRFTVFRVSIKINSLEITCSVFHSVAICTKLLQLKYSDLYKLETVEN